MPRSGWLPVLALVGVGLAWAVNAQPISDDTDPGAGAYEAPAKPPNKDEPVDLGAIHDALKGIASALEAQKNKPASSVEEDRARRDLKAQERMAYWAVWMFVAAGFGVLLTALGIILISKTLLYTRDAAESARDMVIHAANATKSANDTFEQTRVANEIARENLIAQHRPWMVLAADEVGPVHFPWPGKIELNINFSARNIGNSPAMMTMYNAQAFWGHEIRDINDRIAALIKETTGRPELRPYADIVLPKDDTKFGFVQLRARDMHPKAKATDDRPINLIVLCCVVYRSSVSSDWFHTAHTAFVRYKRPPDVHPRDARRFKWSDGYIKGEELEVRLSKSGGASSIV